MVGNEVWEQWGANTGDAQQLQSKPRLGVLHSLLCLLQSHQAALLPTGLGGAGLGTHCYSWGISDL